MADISIVNQCGRQLDEERVRRAVELILEDAGYNEAEVSLALVTDDTIWELNRRHLQHDYPTDVLSFRLDDDTQPPSLEGEIIVSVDTAERQAEHYGWSASDEVLLYVVHGTLHLVGYDDSSEMLRGEMQRAEVQYLTRIDARLGEQHAQANRL